MVTCALSRCEEIYERNRFRPETNMGIFSEVLLLLRDAEGVIHLYVRFPLCNLSDAHSLDMLFGDVFRCRIEEDGSRKSIRRANLNSGRSSNSPAPSIPKEHRNSLTTHSND